MANDKLAFDKGKLMILFSSKIDLLTEDNSCPSFLNENNATEFAFFVRFCREINFIYFILFYFILFTTTYIHRKL